MAQRFHNGIDLREGPLLLGGSAGSPGQVPICSGPADPPTWGSARQTATLDFGAAPQWSATFTITSLIAAVGQSVTMTPSGINGDELEMDNFACSARVTATNTVVAYVTAIPGPVSGTRGFQFLLF